MSISKSHKQVTKINSAAKRLETQGFARKTIGKNPLSDNEIDYTGLAEIFNSQRATVASYTKAGVIQPIKSVWRTQIFDKVDTIRKLTKYMEFGRLSPFKKYK